MLNWSLIFAAEAVEQKAVLLGFDATLPIIVVEFLLLMVVLKALFFEPLTKAMDERSDYVRDTLSSVKSRLAESESLAQQYKQELAQARLQAQSIISEAQAAANDTCNKQIIEAQQAARVKVDKARQEIEQEKETAQKSLEAEISLLSGQIANKLLGAI